MIISRKRRPILLISPLLINSCCLERVSYYKYLGIWIISTLNLSTHISEVRAWSRQQINIIYHTFYSIATNSNLLQHLFNYTLNMQLWVGDPSQHGRSPCWLGSPTQSCILVCINVGIKFARSVSKFNSDGLLASWYTSMTSHNICDVTKYFVI